VDLESRVATLPSPERRTEISEMASQALRPVALLSRGWLSSRSPPDVLAPHGFDAPTSRFVRLVVFTRQARPV